MNFTRENDELSNALRREKALQDGIAAREQKLIELHTELDDLVASGGSDAERDKFSSRIRKITDRIEEEKQLLSRFRQGELASIRTAAAKEAEAQNQARRLKRLEDARAKFIEEVKPAVGELIELLDGMDSEIKAIVADFCSTALGIAFAQMQRGRRPNIDRQTVDPLKLIAEKIRRASGGYSQRERLIDEPSTVVIGVIRPFSYVHVAADGEAKREFPPGAIALVPQNLAAALEHEEAAIVLDDGADIRRVSGLRTHTIKRDETRSLRIVPGEPCALGAAEAEQLMRDGVVEIRETLTPDEIDEFRTILRKNHRSFRSNANHDLAMSSSVAGSPPQKIEFGRLADLELAVEEEAA